MYCVLNYFYHHFNGLSLHERLYFKVNNEYLRYYCRTESNSDSEEVHHLAFESDKAPHKKCRHLPISYGDGSAVLV
jgi:hypothetical protein